MYYQCLELKISGQTLEELPPFVIDCYDSDKSTFSSDSRDFMGRCLIDINEIEYELDPETGKTKLDPETRKPISKYELDLQTGLPKIDPETGEKIPARKCSFIEIDEEGTNDDGRPQKPKWHKFYYKQGGPPCGEVLVSFKIAASFDYEYK